MKVSRSSNGVYITWPISPIPVETFDRLKGIISASTNYRLLTPAQVDEFKKIDPNAISIRNSLLKGKIISNYHRMNKKIRSISAEYRNKSIVELSEKYDFPPLNLLRGIFLSIGYPSSDIYKVFAGRETPEQYIVGRDLAQYNLATANDAEYSFVQKKVAEVAAENERLVVEYFRSIASIQTQEDLTRIQMETHGRAVNTPDVLFTSPVYINNTLVKWLDYKDYTGTKVSFIYRSNTEQAARYVAEWGTGVMCYRGNFIENVKIPGVILVSASYLPINFTSLNIQDE
jgi:Protein of unknown function TPD sequence-motif